MLCVEGYTGAVDAVQRHVRAFECRRHPSTTALFLAAYPRESQKTVFDSHARALATPR